MGSYIDEIQIDSPYIWHGDYKHEKIGHFSVMQIKLQLEGSTVMFKLSKFNS